jgi:hypothetical protein
MNDLQLAIENLYETFSKYTTERIHYCNCGCIDENDVKKLSSKPLRELEADDLISYHGSALYTWGEIEHYKHFLPRICELISVKRDFSYTTLDELQVKLEYAKWTNWPDNEQHAITNYVIADWIDFANKHYSEIRNTELEIYSKFLSIKEVMNLWEVSNTDEALRNFVYFYYNHGTQILNGGLRILEKKYKIEFLEPIQEEEIASKLEYSFFQNEQSNPDYANKISIVLQMIEQEKKTKGS